ncbi:MAG: IS1380 family transposase [Coleofasciculus sp. A1-SPW-01]|uniref:IS1380 family transposase n=1 Tax=Coleofasciculus sp. A1-SPW-01 TaxID=3070819 RepID=UPI0032FE38EC
MTPPLTDCIPKQFKFKPVKSRQVIADFQGGTVTSDAGLTLIADLDRKLQITSRFAACFTDYRQANRIDHSVESLVAQRLYGLVQGYEDVNDHEQLRHDPMFGLALGKIIGEGRQPVVLAGKSTLNRLEHCPETVTNRVESRYHRIGHNASAIEKLFVEWFLESYNQPPKEIILDLDVTDDQVHGEQEKAFFNTYYNGFCYAPLYIFCGKHLLVAKLRPSNVDPADGALEELKRVIKQIRSRWSNVGVLVRGDSAYAREEIMEWCESQVGVDYVFGLSKNNRLMQMTMETQKKARASYEHHKQRVESFLETLFNPETKFPEVENLVSPYVLYRSINYQTQKSWSRPRRVVAKVESNHTDVKVRFVVTSISTKKVPPGELYRQKYCPRGEMENRFKEQQLELFSDRTSTHSFEGNQLRLWFSSVAYVLMNALRGRCLAATDLRSAQVGTIRTKLLKLGARLRVSVRRVLISISSGCPYKDIFATAHRCLQLLPHPG